MNKFHILQPSPWPILSSFAACLLAISFTFFMKSSSALLTIIFLAMLIAVILIAALWWKDVFYESKVDMAHNTIVKKGLRVGMAVFVLSEAILFITLFYSWFNFWLFPNEIFLDNTILEHQWPPAIVETINPWRIPLLNTLILLLSGTTVTWAHHEISQKNNNKDATLALKITIALGALFTLIQCFEYYHAPFSLFGNAIDNSTIYKSHFYILTGFHGVHVIIGNVFLAVCCHKTNKNELTKENHLCLEFAAWYWHFVDVVWLFLFVIVYCMAK